VHSVSLLQAALANASVRHITLPVGRYELNTTLDIGRNVTIEAEAWGSAVLVGGGEETVLRITGGAVELIGLNVTGGNAQERRRLADGNHSATITSGGGGGVAVFGGEVLLLSCNIYANLAAHGGGLSIAAGTVAMRDCAVFGNVAQLTAGGGGIFVHASFAGTLELLGCDVSGNVAASDLNNIVVRAPSGSVCTSLPIDFAYGVVACQKPSTLQEYTVDSAIEDASTATTATTAAIAVTLVTSVASGIVAATAGSKVGLAITSGATSEALAIGRGGQGFSSSTLILLSQVQSIKSLGLLSKELPPTLTRFSSTFSWGSMHFNLGVSIPADTTVPCDDVVACREEAVLTGTALYLYNIGMSAEELFVNNVIFDSAVLLCIVASHKALQFGLRRLNVAPTEVIVAFPKFELVWLLASYEGFALAAAILCKHADQQSTARTAALLSLVAVTAFGLTFTLVWLSRFIRANVHRLTQTGTLEFKPTKSRSKLVIASFLSRTASGETSTHSTLSFESASRPSAQKRRSSQSVVASSTPRASSPWNHAHPPVGSGGLLCKLSHAMGKPPVLRHMASSSAWWDSFAPHEKEEMKALSIQVGPV